MDAYAGNRDQQPSATAGQDPRALEQRLILELGLHGYTDVRPLVRLDIDIAYAEALRGRCTVTHGMHDHEHVGVSITSAHALAASGARRTHASLLSMHIL